MVVEVEVVAGVAGPGQTGLISLLPHLTDPAPR